MSSASIYIPVNALQNLRASMPTLATSASVTSLPSVSRSTASLSLGKSPGQSFLSSVISSKPFAGLNLAPPSVVGPGTSPSKIITRKLWPGRSKSLGRSAWQPHVSILMHSLYLSSSRGCYRSMIFKHVYQTSSHLFINYLILLWDEGMFNVHSY